MWLRGVGIAVAVVAAAAGHPFAPRSEAEAAWLDRQFADAAAQLGRGVFPVYVGQGEAVADGTPLGPPVRYTLGAAAQALTGVPPAAVGRLLAIVCAAGGAWAAHLSLRRAFPAHRRTRVLLAVAYVGVCGELWLAGRCGADAALAVPLVPLLAGELTRGIRRPGLRAAGVVASLLALVWLSHPATGLTATAAAAVALGFWPWRERLRAAGLLALLSAWFAACAGPLGWLPARAWPTDQCAVPAAVLCATAALALRRLATDDRWEIALDVERPGAPPEPIARLLPLPALACVLAGVAAAAGVVTTVRGEPLAVARREPAVPAAAVPDGPLIDTDPLLSNRLHPARDGVPLPPVSNAAAVPLAGSGAGPRSLRPNPGQAASYAQGGYPVAHFIAEPGKRYALTLQYWTQGYSGALRIDGPTRQVVPLPADTGGPAGVRGLRVTAVGGDEPRAVGVVLVGRGDPGAPGGGAYVEPVGLVEYRPDELPVRVPELIPYTARVDAPGDAAVVVTHRRYVPGYAARVNGQRAAVFASADGFAAVTVPGGPADVELRYRGTIAMRAGLLVSVLTAVGLAVVAVRGARRTRQAATPAAAFPARRAA
jgi:hypothetical protein